MAIFLPAAAAVLPPSVFSMISRNNKWRWRSRWRCCCCCYLFLLLFWTAALHIYTCTVICVLYYTFQVENFFHSLLFSSFFFLLLYCLIFHSACWRCVANKKSYDTGPPPFPLPPLLFLPFSHSISVSRFFVLSFFCTSRYLWKCVWQSEIALCMYICKWACIKSFEPV